MHLVKRLGSASLILAAVVLLTACPSQTTISKINADPAVTEIKKLGSLAP